MQEEQTAQLGAQLNLKEVRDPGVEGDDLREHSVRKGQESIPAFGLQLHQGHDDAIKQGVDESGADGGLKIVVEEVGGTELRILRVPWRSPIGTLKGEMIPELLPIEGLTSGRSVLERMST